MANAMQQRPIQKLVAPPIVSTSESSVESELARQAKQIQEQADADRFYDTQISGFYVEPISPSLCGMFVALSLIFTSLIFNKLKR
jgi:hypothetical protein